VFEKFSQSVCRIGIKNAQPDQSDSCQYLTENHTGTTVKRLHEVLDIIGKFGRVSEKGLGRKDAEFC